MHKDAHCAVVIDCWMNKLGEVNFEKQDHPDILHSLRMLGRFAAQKGIVFGLEDTRGFGRNLAAYLVGRKFEVKHVNPAYTSTVRLANPISFTRMTPMMPIVVGKGPQGYGGHSAGCQA
ncbi:IS110 family transposase [Acetivibrio clariflavus]|uniref:IS110 family transposase n=1 Tax=Acetivibrio clariflavus TaxID=288965 RepID=UPI0004B3624C|nr:IS110 family transposase [Acetivibrio clariflavus]